MTAPQHLYHEGIMRCDHIERKEQDTALISLVYQCPENSPQMLGRNKEQKFFVVLCKKILWIFLTLEYQVVL